VGPGVEWTTVARWHPPDGFDALTLPEAQALQEQLAELVREGDGPDEVRLVASVDLGYEARAGLTHAAVVLWEVARRAIVESATASAITSFPYVPGYLAWRELPTTLSAWERLERRPDLVLVDGQGRAHPRRCGLACLVGLALDLPTVGCAKSVLVGGFSALGLERGAWAPLMDRGEVVGNAVRTRSGVRPVYVSVGHRITLERARRWVLATSRFRIPDPLRAAHAAVTDLCTGGLKKP
jgi:deoxyribonuclease V